MMTHLRAVAATAVIAFALTACGASDDDLPMIGTTAGERLDAPQVLEPVVVVDADRRDPVAEPDKPAKQDEPPAEPELVPGPTLYGPGDEGPEVRKVQARLRQIEWFYGDVTDFYGDQTEEAVAGFQAKRGFPVTGEVDQRTLDRLVEMSYEPTSDELNNVEPEPVDASDGAPLDPRCLTGHVLCVDKSSSSLRWVVDGDVQMTLDARFGGNGYFTREGQFSVFSKSRDHVSSLYETSMPFAMFFSGGQAVHYSPDFAAVGYSGASHGCVNIRDYDSIAWLFDQVQIGDGVVVYWS
jgi:Putative peptidoglycan binding domain/L,D-transpeptidase catalytic domain